MKKRMLAFFIISIVVITGCSEEESKPTFSNPVYEPVLADPSIVKDDNGYFYAYGTEDAWGEHSQTVFTPIIKSKNLVDWEYVGPSFEKKPNWKGAGSIWAPDIHKYQGKYYLYYSLSIWGDSNPAIGIATSENPEGPFEDHGKLFTSEEIGVANSIDPYFYVTEEGTPYLFWGSFHGIYGVELTKDGLSVEGEKFQIAGSAFEAPYIIKRGNYYYFFGSSGSCCEGENSTYHVSIGRATEIKGPYLDKNGGNLIMSSGTVILRGQTDGSYVGPGHNAIIQDDEGKDWILYHAINKEDPRLWTGATRRPVLLDPIIWEDDWPTIKDQQPNTNKQPAPIIH